MSTRTLKPMSAVQLISCLSGELLVDPALVLETIKGDADLLRVVKSYRAGDLSYFHVLDTLSDYF